MRSDRFHLWRSRTDWAARWAIAVGGVGVIAAVVLIFFYLLWVVFPLFMPAETRLLAEREVAAWRGSDPVYLAVEEQREIGLRLSTSGAAEFFEAATGQPVYKQRLPLAEGAFPLLAAEAVEQHGLLALATDSGEILVLRHRYETRFQGGVESREILPTLEFPYGETALLSLEDTDLVGLAVSDNEDGLLLAVAGRDGRVRVNLSSKSENFLSGEVTLEPRLVEINVDFTVTALAVSGNQRWLYLGADNGRVHRY
jgi:phosphate transport system permease protein